MKALYSTEIQCENVNKDELQTYNYDSRYLALKEGYKFVHLFQTSIDSNDNVKHEYYSTMQL